MTSFCLCYLHLVLVLAIVLETRSWILKAYIVTKDAILFTSYNLKIDMLKNKMFAQH